jgi:glycine oxidase
LFDKGEPGQEASWASAGILSPTPENPGAIPMVPLGKASLALYPEFAARVKELSGREVGFRPKGTIEALFSRDATRKLSTLIAVYHGLGLNATPLHPDDARELEPALNQDVEAAALRADEASVDNRLLTTAALEAARRKGVEIFPGEPVIAVRRQGSRCAGVTLQTAEIPAQWTIIAAGCFSSSIAGTETFVPVRPVKGQMIALRADHLKIERVLWSERIYLVPRNDGRILAGATVEHVGFDKQVTAGGVEKLLAAALELAPGLSRAQIEETWAGLRPDSPDHLPILGPTDVEGLLIATGHFRSGVLLTPITARLMREWITGRHVSVDWERFSPMRFIEASQGTSA